MGATTIPSRPSHIRPSRSRSPLGAANASPLLRDFLLYLASERGLADNSVHGYRRDIEDLERYLTSRSASLKCDDPEHFRSYLQTQTRNGRSTRTVARRLAAIRIFLRYR